jgi:endonuclease/exonuclease/phosphatase family metal-dependent hydrolase
MAVGLHMRIVSWNCGGWSCGGFNEKKYDEIMRYKPDILLIQEITQKEYDDLTKDFYEFGEFGEPELPPHQRHWYGDNAEESYKGIAIFLSGACKVELAENFNNKFRYVVPYIISSSLSDEKECILLSVWTKQPSDGSWDYQKTIFEALDYYKFDLPIILSGDFNTGSNKDNPHNYKELKMNLEKHGLKNCAENTKYEYRPTFYHDKTGRYFTNDFCFISKEYYIQNFHVDKMDNQKRWRGLSDHFPIIADFDDIPIEEYKEIMKWVKKVATD